MGETRTLFHKMLRKDHKNYRYTCIYLCMPSVSYFNSLGLFLRLQHHLCDFPRKKKQNWHNTFLSIKLQKKREKKSDVANMRKIKTLIYKVLFHLIFLISSEGSIASTFKKNNKKNLTFLELFDDLGFKGLKTMLCHFSYSFGSDAIFWVKRVLTRKNGPPLKRSDRTVQSVVSLHFLHFSNT